MKPVVVDAVVVEVVVVVAVVVEKHIILDLTLSFTIIP